MDTQPLKIAILAMGGEGGGVLADWIVDLGEANGFIGQSTSVPGVAQRTGATVYYVELFDPTDVPAGARPVLALMPLPGDVDIVIASELMEAGRAVQRGLVTTDRTTMIASTHRVYAIEEKTAMGDGRADSETLLREARAAARRVVCFDMAKTAETERSVISAVLFGALCGAGALPFGREQFAETIKRGGIGVGGSLRAFEQGVIGARAQVDGDPRADESGKSGGALVTDPSTEDGRRLMRRVQRDFPATLHDRLREGIKRLVDYQDLAYADQYLDRLVPLQAAAGDSDPRIVGEAARYLALWMSYEDTIRVADLKTRSTRFERVRGEVRARGDQLVEIVEFLHPRMEELCDTLPASVGRWLSRPHLVHRWVARLLRSGRTVRTSSLAGFGLLYLLARLRRIRRSTLRYAVENERIEAWLQRLLDVMVNNAALAVEVAQCPRLVKGYGDTHARGWKNFSVLMAIVEQHKEISPATLRELREAALADEHGRKLAERIHRYGLQ